MRLFGLQLQWEIRKLLARPQTWLGFGLALVFELIVSCLLRIPSVRAAFAERLWGLHIHLADVATGLTSGTHLMGETAASIGTLALALVGGDIIAGEVRPGTLRMIFCHPVSRARVWTLKLLTCFFYAALLSVFIGLSALAVGLAFEGAGPLYMTATHESIVGQFSFPEGLQRYALSMLFLAVSSSFGIVLAFFFSCFRISPAVATALALTVFFADDIIRVRPEFSSLSPYCLSTRLLTWRQVFNNDIPWLRMRRNYIALCRTDAALLAGGWLAFRRRDIQ